MAKIIAAVNNGELEYDYTDSSKTEKSSGSEMGYDQFLTLLCAEMQYQDPLEPTSNTEYVAQLATFSQLEATLSMQETQKNSMANDLVGKQVILEVTNENTGNTSYVDGKVDYVMYKDGTPYLSVNNALYSIDTLDTVADADYYEANALALTFSQWVALFPDTASLTTAYEGAITEARELYEGMTDYQKEFVSEDDLATLAELENRLKELLAAKGEDITNEDPDGAGSEEI